MSSSSRHPPFHGGYDITAGERYSDGRGHWAHDYATPIGTRLYAVRDGRIIDCHWGEPDWPESRWPGMPSNWVLLGYRNRAGEKRTVFYQHLAQGGVEVRRGQDVTAGTLIGRSGNSGNSSGPHLHLVATKGWQTAATRYLYLSQPQIRIYPPSLVWAEGSL